MPDVLFVSKPVVPPWNDSGKNLVWDLSRSLRRHRATIMVRADTEPAAGTLRQLAVYPAHAGGFAPALTDQARVMAHLVGARGFALWHFFFAPNPKSCLAGQLATSLRRALSVHTLSSAPRDARSIVPRLFADVNVVLSRHAEQRLLEAGLEPLRLLRIAPAIAPLTPPDPSLRTQVRAQLGLPPDAPVVVYPGDLEFGEGAPLMLAAQPVLARRGVTLVMACRAKTPAARGRERALRETARQARIEESVRWLGETPHIHALLGCADVVCLPSRDLYAKMDYPLVLLEAMSLGRPVCVAQGSAAAELAEQGGALAIEPDPDALAAAIGRLLDAPSAAQELGERGRADVCARFSCEVMALAYEQLYDRLLGSRP